MPGRIKAEVCLIHKLLVEAGVDIGEVICHHLVVRRHHYCALASCWTHYTTILKKFVKNRLLLIASWYTSALGLDRSSSVLILLYVVSGGCSSLHTFGIFRRVRQANQLLLKLGGDIDVS